jgi:2-keto-4-pentenoate hydratase
MNEQAVLELAGLLLDVRRTKTTLATWPEALVPESVEVARLAQWAQIDGLGGVGGYKIGARTPEDAPLYAPLPAAKVFDENVSTIAFRDFARVGLELEIGFRFKTGFAAQEVASLSDDAILARIDTMHPTIEIVDSRFTDFPNVPKLLQLADLQNNGALVVGKGLPYQPGFDYLAARVQFRCGSLELFSGPAHNPCGDPRRLVAWMVREVVKSGRTIGAGDILTTGSYTKCPFVDEPGEVYGEIEGLGALAFTLS